MEEFVFLDTEKCGRGGKVDGERQQKKPSLGSVVRKRLSDITNTLNSPNQDEKPGLISASAKDYIEQLHKENMALMKLLVERNKFIELTGVELTKMRGNLQKLQQQNWHLAQANSNMLVELNIGKDRQKAMQHELGCKNALLKSFELQEKEIKKGPSEKTCSEEAKGICNPNTRSQSRVQSPGSSDVTEQVAMKEKADDKRQSAVFKSEQPESTEEKADNKRLCSRRQSVRFKPSEQPDSTEEKADDKMLCSRRQSASFKPPEQPEFTEEKADNKRLCSRRQSARFKPAELPEPTDEKSENKRLPLRRHSTRLKSEKPEPTEDLFEIDDAKFPVHTLLDEPMQENGPTSSSTIKEENGTSSLMNDTPDLRRSSIGRPTRKAALKVQSYKEVPLNVKMRRSSIS